MFLTPSGSGNTRSAQLERAERIWERAAASGQLCQAAVGAGSSWAPSSPASPYPRGTAVHIWCGCTSGTSGTPARPCSPPPPGPRPPAALLSWEFCCEE